MAFDQNSIANSLRPLNIVRTVIEDPQIAPVASSTGKPFEGFYANPLPDVGSSPQSGPTVYYPAAIPDAGFINLGFGNAVPGINRWVQNHVLPPLQPGLVGPAIVNSAAGYPSGPSHAAKVGSSASDHSGEESGDNSASGHKVKFLCSFGGKILPRPSDGALRYVGGQTRIISVRRDVSFTALVQKMMDAYGQTVVIKYQLPDEDLDALVSVSGPDDLENMMDEYEKLIERSPDRSAKLRIFLFSQSELEFSGLMHVGDVEDGGRRYVEAVNGIMDGFNGGACIDRNESIESASSAQNSDLSGTEGADNLSAAQGEAVGVPLAYGFSPMGHTGNTPEIVPRMACADSNPALLVDPSSTSSIPVIKPGLTTALGVPPEHAVERSVPLMVPHSLHGVSFSPSHYTHLY